jgi:hypothetical protein
VPAGRDGLRRDLHQPPQLTHELRRVRHGLRKCRRFLLRLWRLSLPHVPDRVGDSHLYPLLRPHGTSRMCQCGARSRSLRPLQHPLPSTEGLYCGLLHLGSTHLTPCGPASRRPSRRSTAAPEPLSYGILHLKIPSQAAQGLGRPSSHLTARVRHSGPPRACPSPPALAPWGRARSLACGSASVAVVASGSVTEATRTCAAAPLTPRAPPGRNPRGPPPPRAPRAPCGRCPRVPPPHRSRRSGRPQPARSSTAPLSTYQSVAFLARLHRVALRAARALVYGGPAVRLTPPRGPRPSRGAHPGHGACRAWW